jgi:hypothetical protein
MQKSELRELVRSRDFISGIYNYCDRWCERCPFTSRCLVYATEKADETFGDPDINDINNAKFWSRLESMFREVREMVVEWAAEEGVDLQTIESEAALKEHEQQKQDAKEHQLSLSARRYAQSVQLWFQEEFAVEQNVHDDTTGKSKSAEDNIDISDAVEVIRWYQFFIAAKMFRALMGFEHEVADDELADNDIFTDTEFNQDEALLNVAGSNSDGSAKIALIAIDRSLSAWRVMQSSLPEKTDSIVPMFLELERLRRVAEQTFPHARDFVRPGFDEISSEFVS